MHKNDHRVMGIISLTLDKLGEGLERKRVKRSKYEKKTLLGCEVHLGCRKTIKLNKEPNTIKTHASAHCLVVNF
ncbi:hypothetical protein Hanom_Chr10g00900631 [Helianthus anomalus]